MPPQLPRRTFLATSALGLLAVACGDEDGATSSSTAPQAAGAYQIVATFPRSEPYAPAGAPLRLPFLIAGSDGAPLDSIDEPVTFRLSLDGTDPLPEVTVEPRGEGLARPYLPLEITLPKVGNYVVAATYRGVEMTTTIPVVDPSQVMVPQVGSELPSLDTPTDADHRGVEPLCTAEPPCSLHGVNLADALAAGRPTLLLVSTPRYCQVAICGPVLDLLVDATAGRDDLAVIHHEVYANPDAVDSVAQADLAPLLTTYGLTFEPALFAVDATRTLRRRLDAVYDRTELREAIEAITA